MMVQAKLKKKTTARIPNDGMRLAAIMLDPKHCGLVSRIMASKKDWKDDKFQGNSSYYCPLQWRMHSGAHVLV
jgi:hypothetical protein